MTKPTVDEMMEKITTEAAGMNFCTECLMTGSDPEAAGALAEKLIEVINREGTGKLDNATIALAVVYLMDTVAATAPEGSYRHTIMAMANIAVNIISQYPAKEAKFNA